ncbi:hypothetical protein HDU93_001796 [Gonapodya sp. JEL0774]|nr:hypothetical protein HDU93_001796 [Gonapodya sp. JEL0774]
MKLVNSTPNSVSEASLEEPTVDTAAQVKCESYISRGNKLVRIGAGTPLPQFTLSVRRRKESAPQSNRPASSTNIGLVNAAESGQWIKKRGHQIINRAALASVAKSETVKRERLRVAKVRSQALTAVKPGTSVVINGATYQKSTSKPAIRAQIISVNGLEYIKDPRKKTLKLRVSGRAREDGLLEWLSVNESICGNNFNENIPSRAGSMLPATLASATIPTQRHGRPPKTLNINGDVYVRTKGGNLRRISSRKPRHASDQYCRFFTRYGKCANSKCKLPHVETGGYLAGKKRKAPVVANGGGQSFLASAKRQRTDKDNCERGGEQEEDEDDDVALIRPDFDNILFADLPEMDSGDEDSDEVEDDQSLTEEDSSDEDEDDVHEDADIAGALHAGEGPDVAEQNISDSESPDVQIVGEVALADEDEDDEAPEVIELDEADGDEFDEDKMDADVFPFALLR